MFCRVRSQRPAAPSAPSWPDLRLRETPYDVSHQLRTITGGELRRVQDHIMLRDTSASNARSRLMWRLMPDTRSEPIL
jgi:hypothetical protein